MGILGSWKMARAKAQIMSIDCVREFVVLSSSDLRGLSIGFSGCHIFDAYPFVFEGQYNSYQTNSV